jgi:mono/diheme cytochrome c family protein
LLFFLTAILVVASAQTGEMRQNNSEQPTPSAKYGAELFAKSGCTFCHGPQGMGTDKAPNLRDVRKRKTDEQIFHQIHDGGRMMPPFADALAENEIWSLVQFLREEHGWDLLSPPRPGK